MTRPGSYGPQVHPLPVPGRTVFVGNNEFLVREAGLPDAPPIVLLHGWVYDSIETFNRLVPLLVDRFRVIMIDQRNHGGSSRLHEDYEIETVADETAAVMDRLEATQATVFGYSMGGMVAQALARRHPGHVRRMVLAATAAKPMRRPLVDAVAMVLLRPFWKIGLLEGARMSHRVLRTAGAFAPAHPGGRARSSGAGGAAGWRGGADGHAPDRARTESGGYLARHAEDRRTGHSRQFL